jgi:hypothetical protein
MKIKIISTLSQKYWDQTGQYTVKTWPDYIPKNSEIWLHDTPNLPIDVDRYISTKEKNIWLTEAEIFSKNIPSPPGYMKEWKKFTHKSFAQWECYEENPNGVMVWLDADVKMKKPLTEEILLNCLDGKFCGYFGRDRVNTKDPIFKKEYRHYERLTIEGCFIIYDLNHPIAKDFFKEFKNTYKSMKLFEYFDWCDTGAFEYTKNQFPAEFFNDITGHLPPVPSPLTISILDEYLEHWMGLINKKGKADIIGIKEKKALIDRGILK